VLFDEISVCAEELQEEALAVAWKHGRRTQVASFVLYLSELTMSGRWMIGAEVIDRSIGSLENPTWCVYTGSMCCDASKGHWSALIIGGCQAAHELSKNNRSSGHQS
jgi:hypothetical protein